MYLILSIIKRDGKLENVSKNKIKKYSLYKIEQIFIF